MGPKRCIFCGSRVNSVEDAIPRWLLRHHEHLYNKGPTSWTWGAIDDPVHRRKGTWDGLAIRVRSVCNLCNNGWMSDLERETQPLMEPMMSDLRCVTMSLPNAR